MSAKSGDLEHTRCLKAPSGWGATVLWRRCSCPNLPLWHFKAFRILERGVDNVQSIKIHTQTHTRQTHARCSGRTLRIRNASKIFDLLLAQLILAYNFGFQFDSHTPIHTEERDTHIDKRTPCVCDTQSKRHTQTENTRHRNLCFGFSFLSFLFFSTPVTRKGFLRVSFCTFRVLVRTTDVQRNATATTRFADGSWTPPKAAAEAAATAAAAELRSLSFSLALLSIQRHLQSFYALLSLCCCCSLLLLLLLLLLPWCSSRFCFVCLIR